MVTLVLSAREILVQAYEVAGLDERAVTDPLFNGGEELDLINATLAAMESYATQRARQVREECAVIAESNAVCGCERSDCYSDNIPRGIATAIRMTGRE